MAATSTQYNLIWYFHVEFSQERDTMIGAVNVEKNVLGCEKTTTIQ